MNGTKVETVSVLPLIMRPEGDTILLGTLDTFSVSTHRSLKQVRPFGHVSPKGLALGGRTIAGTLIFTQLFESVISSIVPHYNPQAGVMADEIPPFDILLALPSGGELDRPTIDNMSYMLVRGIKIMDGAFMFSIDNLISEEQYSYVAMDMEHLHPEQLHISGELGNMITGGSSNVNQYESAPRLQDELGNDIWPDPAESIEYINGI